MREGFILELVNYLELEVPFKIEIVPEIKGGVVGLCWAEKRKGKLARHRIKISLQEDYRDFETLLAHEFIHAWQEENVIWQDIYHCARFRSKAKELSQHFSLPNIYLPGLDTE